MASACRDAAVVGALGIALALLGTGCGVGGDAGPAGAGGVGEAGKVVVDGSSTVFKISKAAQIAFKKSGSSINVLVGNHGTGGGFGRYLQGEVDIVDASRAAKPEEEAQAREKGLEWTRFVVGYDGISVVKHPENQFLQTLTVDQLRDLFKPDSTIYNWNDLNPAWPARKIVLYTPDNDSGTFEYFTEAIIGAKDQRKDVQASPDDNVLVTGVGGDRDGLGYFGFAYYIANQQKLTAVPIQNGPDAQPVAPTYETILAQSYQPLSRPLYLYVKNKAMARPEVAAFLRYYIENIDVLARQVGYVPPHEEDQQANLKALPAVGGAAPAPATTTPTPAPETKLP